MADNAHGPPERRSGRAANPDARGTAKRAGAHVAALRRRGKSAADTKHPRSPLNVAVEVLAGGRLAAVARGEAEAIDELVTAIIANVGALSDLAVVKALETLDREQPFEAAKVWQRLNTEAKVSVQTLNRLVKAARAHSAAQKRSRDQEGARDKPLLTVERHNPEKTLAALRNTIASAQALYERGLLVRPVYAQELGHTIALPVTANDVVRIAHELARPCHALRDDSGTSRLDAAFPKALAEMFLDWREGWCLPLLNGFTSAPLLSEDGSIVCAKGYDANTGLWCEGVPALGVPAQPTKPRPRLPASVIARFFNLAQAKE
jgi:hypothetical protein